MTITMKKKKPTLKSEAAALLARLRWKGTTAQERIKFMTEIGQLGGRPRDTSQKRCPCGNMTLKRAETRADKKGKSFGHRSSCPFWKKDGVARRVKRRKRKAE